MHRDKETKQRASGDLCDLLFVSQDYTGRFGEEISLVLVIFLGPSVCLSVCLMFLSPSLEVAFPCFYSPLKPGWFRLWFSPTSPSNPSLYVLAVPQGSTHLVSIMFAAALVSHPSLPLVSCLPFLSLLRFYPCLQLSVSGPSDSNPLPKKCSSISLTRFVFFVFVCNNTIDQLRSFKTTSLLLYLCSFYSFSPSLLSNFSCSLFFHLCTYTHTKNRRQKTGTANHFVPCSAFDTLFHFLLLYLKLHIIKSVHDTKETFASKF